ncbi:hypothetical protein J3A76_002353 [Methylobacterium sp. PvP109]|uniref:Uncharacterized protein n=1 Tax=Methylobacterium radiotolerans TaxID=31998 RepID=A0ABV2NDC7_9HYPH|nr:hypothetical protein [Methylobacterium sp. PvP105]MBP2501358.1 hypothetical protein [Methylobacterium sp. PvP109]GEM95792.1 hypothetical protein MRA01_03320 [Methylobacterium radiotolerans]
MIELHVTGPPGRHAPPDPAPFIEDLDAEPCLREPARCGRAGHAGAEDRDNSVLVHALPRLAERP